jgi:hypothetical protein
VRPLYYRFLRCAFRRTPVLFVCLGAASLVSAQRLSQPVEFASLPDAPQPQSAPGAAPLAPSTPVSSSTARAVSNKNCPPPASVPADAQPRSVVQTRTACPAKFDIFYPLGKPPATGRLTSTDKLRIAASNVVDPFNLATIGVSAAITIGINSDTAYGPGMKGWAKNSGTLLTEDMTGAFFVTFLVPSLTGQDPRYYRMPKASIPRRIANAIVQPVWSKSDEGNHMLNLASFLGIPAAIALANVYVPGRKQGIGSIAESSAIAIASSPIDTLTTEFLPDVAKRFKIRIVLIQQIVNHIALTGGQQ